MRKNIDFFLIIYLFFFFFSPPIIPKINVNIIQAVVSLFYVLIHYSQKNIMHCIKQANISKFLRNFYLVFIYMLIVSLMSMIIKPVNMSNYINSFYGIFLFSIVLTINIVYIILKCQELSWGLEDLLRHCIYAGIIQACIAIIMLMEPDVRRTINNIIYNNTGNELLEKDWFIYTRGYAFANNTIDLFGYGVGIMAGISFYLGMERKKIYILYSVLLIILIFLNARTGIVMAFLGVGIWFFIQLKQKKVKIGKYIFLILLLMCILFIVFKFLENEVPGTAKWVIRDIEGMLQKLRGKEVGKGTVVYQLFSSSFWELPGIIGLLFGTGHTVYRAVGYQHSDVGYINLIWQIGIFGMLSMMLIFGNIFWDGYKACKNKLSRWLIVYAALAFYIFNIKAGVLSYSPGSAITMLSVFSTIYFSKNKIIIY